MMGLDIVEYDGQQYLKCSMDISEVDNFVLEMIKNNKIPGLAGVGFSQMDDTIEIKYDIRSMDNADKVLTETKDIRYLVDVLDGISTALSNIGSYMLTIDCLLFDMNYIFLDKKNRKAVMIALPVENQSNDVRRFINDSLEKYNFGEDTRTNEISGSLFNFVKANETIDAEKLHQFVDKLKKRNVPVKANLVPYIINEQTKEKCYIVTDSFSIGRRAKICDYAVSGARYLSRLHATIYKEENIWYIKDEDSSNHTYVNGMDIGKGAHYPLSDGDTFRLATECFQFGLEEVSKVPIRKKKKTRKPVSVKNGDEGNDEQPWKGQTDPPQDEEDTIVPVSPEERITLYELLSRFNSERYEEYKRQRAIDKTIKQKNKKNGKVSPGKTSEYAIPKKK